MTTWQEWRNEQRYRLTQQRLDTANDLRLIHQVALFDKLQTILDPLPKGTIGFYWPVRGEIDCRDFICGRNPLCRLKSGIFRCLKTHPS